MERTLRCALPCRSALKTARSMTRSRGCNGRPESESCSAATEGRRRSLREIRPSLTSQASLSHRCACCGSTGCRQRCTAPTRLPASVLPLPLRHRAHADATRNKHVRASTAHAHGWLLAVRVSDLHEQPRLYGMLYGACCTVHAVAYVVLWRVLYSADRTLWHLLMEPVGSAR